MTMMDSSVLHTPPNTITKSPPRSILRTPGVKTKTRSPLSTTADLSTPVVEPSPKRHCVRNQEGVGKDMKASDIKRRAVKLFTVDDKEENESLSKSISELPCMAPRVFASFLMHLESSNKRFKTPTRSTRRNEPSLQYIKPLLSLLRAFVNVELVSLEGQRLDGQRPKAMIYFNGMDCSSTQPPDDRIVGSESHQHDSIEALQEIMVQVDDLCQKQDPTCLSCLNGIIDFLDMDLTTVCQTVAQSISRNFPPDRVKGAITFYFFEFKKIRDRAGRPSIHRTPAPNLRLASEKRFAELVGQSIRCGFRRLFNYPPPRASPQDVNYDQWTERFSRVNALLQMDLPLGTENDAVDDGCISAIISAALSTLCQYFGPDFADLSSPLPELCTTFCQRPASNQRLSTGKKAGPCGLVENPGEVFEDISDAALFLAASRAANFLDQLWKVKGIDQEIERCGGWSHIENYATMSWKFGLWKVIPEDSHLVAFSNVTGLKERLNKLAPQMKSLERDCSAALEALFKRFHLSTKAKTKLEKCPLIPAAARYYHDQLALANFPTVKSV